MIALSSNQLEEQSIAWKYNRLPIAEMFILLVCMSSMIRIVCFDFHNDLVLNGFGNMYKDVRCDHKVIMRTKDGTNDVMMVNRR